MTTVSREPKHIKRILCSTLALLVLLAAVGLAVAGWEITTQLLAPEDHWGLHPETAYGVIYRKYPELETWHDSIAARGQWRDTTLVNAQGLTMHAIYVPCDGATATAVVCHGYHDSAPIMMRYTYLYNHEFGMNTLMPEWQYHGNSGGDHIQMGWMDRFDALRFIDMAHSIWPDQPIVLHGISMGATTALCTAGEGVPDYVHGVVADCGFTNLSNEFDFYFRRLIKLPWMEEGDTLAAVPFGMAASAMCKLRYGWSFGEASALSMVPKIQIPVFFIHGEGDPMVPVEMAYQLYDAKTQGERELWTPVSTRHARSIHEHWPEYIEHVGAFVRHVTE